MVQRYIVLALISANPEDLFGCHIVGEHDLFPMIYRRVYGPESYWACSEWIIFHCKPIHKWWQEEEHAAKEKEESAKRDKSFQPNIVPFETKKVEIGHISGVPEVKIEWEGGWIKHPVLYHRDSKITAYAEFAAPDLSALWGDITSCAAAAAAGAGLLAAIFASPAAALPAFKAAFLACLIPKIGDRAKQISVALSTQQEHGEWHRV